MYQIKIKPKAQKEFQKLPKIYQEKVLATFLFIQQNPFCGKKLLGELSGLYSYRLWPYRIIYEIYAKELVILVIRIGHRQKIYK